MLIICIIIKLEYNTVIHQEVSMELPSKTCQLIQDPQFPIFPPMPVWEVEGALAYPENGSLETEML